MAIATTANLATRTNAAAQAGTQAQSQTGAQQVTAVAPPSAIWRMLATDMRKKKLPKGLDAVWDSGAGYLRRSLLRRHRFLNQAGVILASQSRFGPMSDGALEEIAERMRDKFRLNRETPDDLNTAFGIIRELVYRIYGFRLHQTQIAASLALHNGAIAQLATGEGKTLASCLPAILAGWRGRGCHVLTVNDYLAARDCDECEPLYKACGLTVASIIATAKSAERHAAYRADVTYLTNKEAAADFLRDRLALGDARGLTTTLIRRLMGSDPDTPSAETTDTEGLVMRGLEAAIIDEADSVLIDEAVTPLIISGSTPSGEQLDAYVQASAMADKLDINTHYIVNPRFKEITFTAEGRRTLQHLAREYGGMWAVRRRREELVNQALHARSFFRRDEQYILQRDTSPGGDGKMKVVIIDEGTGRLQPDRTWREGLHQAIEAKEGVELTPPKATLARVSFQRFFRLYRNLGGMTGTAEEARNEFWQIYHKPAVPIPTHRPVIREQYPERVFTTLDHKFTAVIEEIKKIHDGGKGRPILIGTRSVDTTATIGDLLLKEGLPHEVLNAVNHAQESEIVGAAGELGRITVATNMAGRGTDIKLGPGVRDLGGLHVIAVERNDSGRVDRQLFGRAGRQGDPGSCSLFVSLEDELIRRYGSKLLTMSIKNRGDTNGELPGRARRLFVNAQRKAEAIALAQRKGVLKNDDWLDDSLGFAGRDL